MISKSTNRVQSVKVALPFGPPNEVVGRRGAEAGREARWALIAWLPALAGAAGIALGIMSISERTLIIPGCAVATYLLGVMAVTLTGPGRSEGELRLRIFQVSFCLRLVVTVLAFYVLNWAYGIPFVGENDDSVYDALGRRLAEDFRSPEPLAALTALNHPGYPALCGIFVLLGDFFGGYHPMIPRLFNCLLDAGIVVLVRVVSLRVFGANVSRTATLLAAVYPESLYYSALQLRDTIIAFLVLACIAAMVTANRPTLLGTAAVVAGSVVCLWFFRTSFAIAVAGVVVSTSLLRMVLCHADRRTQLVGSLAGILLVAGGPIVAYSIKGSDPTQRGFVEETLVYKLKRGQDHSFGELSGTEASSSSILQRLNSMIPIEPLRNVVFAGLMQVMPYPPWTVLKPEHPLSWLLFGGGLMWTLLLPLYFTGLFTAWTRFPRESLLIVITWLLVVTIAGISFFNDRYRLPGMPFGLMLAALGFHAMKGRQNFLMFYWAAELAPLAAFIALKL